MNDGLYPNGKKGRYYDPDLPRGILLDPDGNEWRNANGEAEYHKHDWLLIAAGDNEIFMECTECGEIDRVVE